MYDKMYRYDDLPMYKISVVLFHICGATPLRKFCRGNRSSSQKFQITKQVQLAKQPTVAHSYTYQLIQVLKSRSSRRKTKKAQHLKDRYLTVFHKEINRLSTYHSRVRSFYT